ncbi:MAG: riboflavin kinase [Patescibacteria group bacterium]
MTVRGAVVHGKGEARGIGYPTANVAHQTPGLVPGVYLARVLADTAVHQALAVVGMWTDDATGQPSLEVHLLDFTGELYGKTVTVSIGKKLRDLLTFTDEATLVAQIKKDIQDARGEFNVLSS